MFSPLVAPEIADAFVAENRWPEVKNVAFGLIVTSLFSEVLAFTGLAFEEASELVGVKKITAKRHHNTG